MEHQKILNLLNEPTILNSWRENGTLLKIKKLWCRKWNYLQCRSIMHYLLNVSQKLIEQQ